MLRKGLISLSLVVLLALSTSLALAGREPPPRDPLTCATFASSASGITLGASTGIAVELSEGDELRFEFTLIAGSPGSFLIEINPGPALEGPVSGSAEFEAPADGVYTITIFTGPPEVGSFNFRATCRSADEARGPAVGEPCDNLFDGRINNSQARDCAAPVAIYPNDDGGYDVYAIDPDTGEGVLVAEIPGSDLAGDPPTENVLLAAVINPHTGKSILLYRLASDEFFVMTQYADSKAYEVSWPLDNPASLFHNAA